METEHKFMRELNVVTNVTTPNTVENQIQSNLSMSSPLLSSHLY